MNNKVTYIIGGVVVLAVILSLFSGGSSDSKVGSIERSNAYYGTTTYNGSGAVNIQKDAILQGYPGEVGNVLITGAVAGSIILYDATSSNPNLTTSRASTTLAVFPASTAAGNYPVDRIFTQGLLVSFSSATAIPTSTITWR